MMGQSLLEKVCETKQVKLLADMIALSNLTSEDVASLQEALKNKETVQETTCTCLENFNSCSCQHVS